MKSALTARRRLAARLKLAQKDQIVLIAGKGHEDYQIFKDHTIAFNEREIVKEFLEVLGICLQLPKS